MPPRSKATQSLGIEATLWDAANKLRGNMDSAEYKHVALGLIFLKYVSDAFAEQRTALEQSLSDPSGDDYIEDEADRQDILESRDEYLGAGVFWVPAEARWDGPDGIQAGAKQADIGRRIDAAMDAIERENPSLRGVLPKNYSRQELDIRRLGELVDLIGGIGLGTAEQRKGDVLGRVYEYFLGQFAANEGKGGGEFYTPRSVVRLLVEMLEPYKGRVYDPCCGSGGMFVQAEDFVLAHGGNKDAISVYGQESNATTWRIAKMNWRSAASRRTSGLSGATPSTTTSTRICGPTSSSRTRPLTSAIGAEISDETTHGGSTVCRQSATPTSPGSSTS